MHEAWQLGDATERPAVTSCVLSSHRGRTVTAMQRDEVRGTISEMGAWQVLVD